MKKRIWIAAALIFSSHCRGMEQLQIITNLLRESTLLTRKMLECDSLQRSIKAKMEAMRESLEHAVQDASVQIEGDQSASSPEFINLCELINELLIDHSEQYQLVQSYTPVNFNSFDVTIVYPEEEGEMQE